LFRRRRKKRVREVSKSSIWKLQNEKDMYYVHFFRFGHSVLEMGIQSGFCYFLTFFGNMKIQKYEKKYKIPV
jgi:hypothetical protein